MDDDTQKRKRPSQQGAEKPEAEQPEAKQTTPSEETEGPQTVSLLDLLGGPTEPQRITITLPEDEGEGDEDEGEMATLTTMEPAKPEPEKPKTAPPPPFSSQTLTPPEQRPLVNDKDATVVQPHVAIPGQRKPVSEAETQVYRRRAQPQADDEQKLMPKGTPKREPGQTTRQQTTQRPSPPQHPPTTTSPRQGQTTPRQPVREQPLRVVIPDSQPKPQPKPVARRNWRSCFTRLLAASIIIGLIGFALLVAGSAVAYNAIAGDLPNPAELASRASTFETSRIYDRNGTILYSLANPDAGNRTRVTLDQISLHLRNATIATEDARFYTNPGFDPIGIARAVVQAAREREFVSGASTITQQLVRALLLDEEERTQRTFTRKVREIILAAEISRTYTKDEILELYLNEIYYGNLAYGIEAASRTYFGKSASELTLSEASLLAGLPQAPAAWDPYSAPEKAIGRQSEVLSQMVAEGYITVAEAQNAIDDMNFRVYDLTPPRTTISHPHFSFTVLQQAEDLLGAQAIYRGGLRIYTTLDPTVQRMAEDTVSAQRSSIVAAGANNAAMVVIKPDTGEILALVGSVDFDDEAISGQVNMALQPRQPGSTMKPLVYLSAMEKGWTPATLIWDVPTQFPDGANPPYEPKNYDDEFHGPLLLRPSLGNSYNIPAVKALEFVGVCNFIANVQKVGLTSLQDDGCVEQGQPRNYGLSLTLGGGAVTPLEMAGAFAAFANQGQYRAPFAIARIEDNQGNLLFEQTLTSPEEAQVISREQAYLMNNMLSDNGARQPEFGQNNNLVIAGHQVAAKTGTTGTSRFDVRDGWTIGYTPQVVTAVWVGNTNNEPVGEGASGYVMASPIWRSFMLQYLADKQPANFPRPEGIVDVEICADSGARASEACPNRRTEVFVKDQLPLDSKDDFLQRLSIDLWTNQIASERCTESVFEATFVNLVVSGAADVLERERGLAKNWIEGTGAGQNWAERRNISLPLRLPPTETCSGDSRPVVTINQPREGAEVMGEVEVRGTVKGPNFNGYQVEFGLSHNPGGWGLVQERRPEAIEDGRLALWDTSDINQAGDVTLRVVIFGPNNPYTPEDDPVTLEARVPLTLLEPTATPTTTPTETPTPTQTPTTTSTAVPTETPTETPTVAPSATPTIQIILSPPPPNTATPTPDNLPPTATPGSDDTKPTPTP
ncbi:MAG: PBP1A family penicillin-binding protein [Ardenticatenaceae bacterium]|nr:PBP1A family penicillin-binding protein [Ardenticatenaceae bacterium]